MGKVRARLLSKCRELADLHSAIWLGSLYDWGVLGAFPLEKGNPCTSQNPLSENPLSATNDDISCCGLRGLCASCSGKDSVVHSASLTWRRRRHDALHAPCTFCLRAACGLRAFGRSGGCSSDLRCTCFALKALPFRVFAFSRRLAANALQSPNSFAPQRETIVGEELWCSSVDVQATSPKPNPRSPYSGCLSGPRSRVDTLTEDNVVRQKLLTLQSLRLLRD